MSEESKNGAHEAQGELAASSGTPPAKKTKLNEESLEDRDFDEETQKALEEIDATQNEIDVFNEKASEEILKVEQKYNKQRKPFYNKRNEIIKRIPKFWLTAFINHPHISSVIEEDDEDALQYLYKLEVEEFEDIKSGYKLKFYFEKNPYFDNEVLVKEFLLGPTGDPTSQCSTINWKEGQDLIAKASVKVSSTNSKGRKRAHERHTFFNWFSDLSEPSADEIAEIIKDDLWPNPLQYFLVPDIEVENGDDEDVEDEEDVVVLEEEEEEEEVDEGEEEEAA